MTDVYYDPFSNEIDDDPFPVYRRLRDEAPVYRNEQFGFYALSRYDDVRAALMDTAVFSSELGITIEDVAAGVPPSMIMMDPPRHTRMRRLIGAVFTPKRAAALEHHVRELARELLDELVPRGAFDVVTDYAAVLPMAVICELLGVPRADQARMRRWSELVVGRPEDAGPDFPEQAMRAGLAIQQYFEALVAERHVQPGDDIVSVLLHADAGGEPLTDEEVVGFLWLLLVAGNDTSTRTIANACFWLDAFPAQLAALSADRTLVAGAVEETLRYDGAAHMIGRTTRVDTQVGGAPIPAGAKVAMLLASANRDERRWPDPDTFDVRRDATGHLAFGHGIHHCLGAPLGRLEARVGLDELLARVGTFSVDPSSPERARSNAFRGFRRLRIVFDA
jgi:cytochrome P450